MAFPKKARFVVIGAGIHGLSTAWHLSEKLKKKNGNNSNNDIVVIDKITYAGNLNNLGLLLHNKRLKFIKADICNYKIIKKALAKTDLLINAAAESHVDKSIDSPDIFIESRFTSNSNVLVYFTKIISSEVTCQSADKALISIESGIIS